jgi:hypothetical protein
MDWKVVHGYADSSRDPKVRTLGVATLPMLLRPLGSGLPPRSNAQPFRCRRVGGLTRRPLPMRARAVAFSAAAVGWTFGQMHCMHGRSARADPFDALHHAGADLSLGRSGTAAPPLRHCRRSAQQRSSDAPCGAAWRLRLTEPLADLVRSAAQLQGRQQQQSGLDLQPLRPRSLRKISYRPHGKQSYQRQSTGVNTAFKKGGRNLRIKAKFPRHEDRCGFERCSGFQRWGSTAHRRYRFTLGVLADPCQPSGNISANVSVLNP